jgi:hypothetical protein
LLDRDDLFQSCNQGLLHGVEFKQKPYALDKILQKAALIHCPSKVASVDDVSEE